MIILYIITFLAATISFIINRKKTQKAFLVAAKKLWMITPQLTSIIVIVSILTYLVPNEIIIKYLGNNNSNFAILIASSLGSITVMPGPIVYPICGIFLSKGISYSVIAAFSTSLMMVGIVTFPIEKSFFGKKFALYRNFLSFIISIIIAFIFKFVTGILI